MTAVLEYEDLIGVPFQWNGRGPRYGEGIDCWQLLRELHRRAGVEIPECDSFEAVERLWHGFQLVGLGLDSATRELDVLYRPGEPYGHVSVVVDARRRRALTTSHGRRGVLSVPVRALQGVRGVYRWRGSS